LGKASTPSPSTVAGMAPRWGTQPVRVSPQPVTCHLSWFGPAALGGTMDPTVLLQIWQKNMGKTEVSQKKIEIGCYVLLYIAIYIAI